MDEERGFLKAIAADPDDDLVRLVFADWLEERGDFRHEYLRMIVDWAARLDEDDPGDLRRKQLDALAERIDLVWREAVGMRFDVVLESCDPERKIYAIKLVCEHLELGLSEAISLVEAAPRTLKHGLLLENALKLRSLMRHGQSLQSRYGRRFPERPDFCVVSIRRSSTLG